MKKHKKTLLVLVSISALVIISASILVAASPTSRPEEKKKTEAEPLVITVTDDKNGKVIIYQDDESVYEYEGPIKMHRKDGKYLIEVHTNTCSCFGDGNDTTIDSEVEE